MLLAGLVLVVPGWARAADEATAAPHLAVRGVDATGGDVVRVTFAYGGDEGDVSGAVVTDNGVERDLVGEVVPLATTGASRAVVIAVDTSEAMDPVMADLRDAVTAVVEALPGDVSVGIATFSDRFVPVRALTTDRARVLDSVSQLQANGESVLWNGIQGAAGMLDSDAGEAQPTVVVITGSGSYASVTTAGDAVGTCATPVPRCTPWAWTAADWTAAASRTSWAGPVGNWSPRRTPSSSTSSARPWPRPSTSSTSWPTSRQPATAPERWPTSSSRSVTRRPRPPSCGARRRPSPRTSSPRPGRRGGRAAAERPGQVRRHPAHPLRRRPGGLRAHHADPPGRQPPDQRAAAVRRRIPRRHGERDRRGQWPGHDRPDPAGRRHDRGLRRAPGLPGQGRGQARAGRHAAAGGRGHLLLRRHGRVSSGS